MGALRWFCDYVVAKPNLPGSSRVSLPEKYGPLVTSFTKYDLPIHAADRPRKKRYALSPRLRDDFFEFLRLEYLRNHFQPHVAARNYTAIILQAEIGARSSELLGIHSEGESCDIDELNGRIRLGSLKARSPCINKFGAGTYTPFLIPVSSARLPRGSVGTARVSLGQLPTARA